MSEEMNRISFTDENGDSVELEVIEETRINGISYILVADEEDNAFILKNTAAEDAEEACYEAVEDDHEIDYISKVFAELLEDIELE